MIEVEYDGDTLVANGTTKAAQVALRGQQRNDGPVVIARDDIGRVEWKPATALVNGRLTVHTVAGNRYVLHFRRKQAPDFTELATQLGVNV